MYRAIVAQDPHSRAARLGLARVVMWQGRYREAIAMFAELEGVDALDGRAAAEYGTFAKSVRKENMKVRSRVTDLRTCRRSPRAVVDTAKSG